MPKYAIHLYIVAIKTCYAINYIEKRALLPDILWVMSFKNVLISLLHHFFYILLEDTVKKMTQTNPCKDITIFLQESSVTSVFACHMLTYIIHYDPTIFLHLQIHVYFNLHILNHFLKILWCHDTCISWRIMHKWRMWYNEFIMSMCLFVRLSF